LSIAQAAEASSSATGYPAPHRRSAGESVESAVESALAALRRGEAVLVVEDMAGGSAVFAVLAAQFATPEAVNALASEARGVVAVTLTHERAKQLDCSAIERRRAPVWLPWYGVSVEAAEGVSTGISAADRSLTCQWMADPTATAAHFVRPGHIMPAVVARRGVLDRPYGAEAAHDLVVLAGLQPAAAFSHVLADLDDAGPEHVPALAERLGWPVVRVSAVLAWRAQHERLVHVQSEGSVETTVGQMRIRIYASDLDSTSHIALVRDPEPGRDTAALPLVRLHSQCVTGDILHSRRCDCGQQLQLALGQVAQDGHGAVLYLRQEGRGIGLVQKIRAYALQDQGLDTFDANVQLGFAPDERDYAAAAQMLRDLGMTRIRLLTNNPDKVWALGQLGIEVVERVSIEVAATPENARYLQTKRDRMGHWLQPPTQP
jgi:3,4-dihydroxy 2-butanone 4-phosphate synthase/GTP cyclohydrolase II